MDERKAFEAWFSDQGQWTNAVQRNGDNYLLSAAQSAWIAWQAATAAERERCLRLAEHFDWATPSALVDAIRQG